MTARCKSAALAVERRYPFNIEEKEHKIAKINVKTQGEEAGHNSL